MAVNSAKSTPKKRGRPAGAQIDTSWHPKFLQAFGQSLNVSLSAQVAGVDRATVYAHKKQMPDFAEAWDDAKEDATERLEAEAYRRARKASDTLMIFLLKAHKPERYREQYAIVGPTGGAIQIDINREISKIYGDVEGSTNSSSGEDGADG